MKSKMKQVIRSGILFKVLFIIIIVNSFSSNQSPLDIKNKTYKIRNNFIVDNAKIIEEEYQKKIEEILTKLYKENISEIRIITIKKLNNTDIETLSLNLSQNKIGDSSSDNGILILISKEDREYRIEIGRGLEQILNDGKVGRIARENLIPEFKNKNYSLGIYKTIREISIILNEKSDLITKNINKENNEEKSFNHYIILTIFLIFFIVLNKIIKEGKKKEKNNKNENKNLETRKEKRFKKKKKESKGIDDKKNIKKKRKDNFDHKGKFGGGGQTGRW